MDEPAYCGVIMIKTPAEQSAERTHKSSYENKQTGYYRHVTTKETVSRGEYVDRSTGQVGYKEEVKVSSTCKFGNDSKGYSGKYTKEEKFKSIHY
uniref:Uncharacterized protein n=1 Tax=Nelumbo nucifera TaxID=4432 RepID=A0A822YHH1_NELNU|nr:TPA_asm: hypothetical protein HUJ06_010808 [Nelumbo nucifera]